MRYKVIFCHVLVPEGVERVSVALEIDLLMVGIYENGKQNKNAARTAAKWNLDILLFPRILIASDQMLIFNICNPKLV